MKTIFALLVLVLLMNTARAGFSAPVSVAQGETVKLYSIDDDQLRRAVLYFRRADSRQFMTQRFTQNGRAWSATLDGAYITLPGIEFYVELEFADGKVKTDPPAYPTYNPRRLQVTPAPALSIRLAASQPSDDALAFEVQGDVGDDVRIMLDGQDVTSLVTRNNKDWVLDNRFGVVKDSAVMQLQDASGTVIASSQVNPAKAAARAAKDRELIVRGNVSLNVGGRNDSNADGGDLSLSGNLHVETEYKQGEFQSEFSGINVNYQRAADPEFNLSSGFLLSNRFRQHRLDVGDVSVTGAPLVLSGFSRRGLAYIREGEDWSGSLFNVRTSSVDGWQSGLSFDDRQTYGASYKQPLGEQGSVQMSVLSGTLQSPSSDNVTSANNNPQAGDSIGIQITSQLAGTTIEAQVAGSRFDDNIADAIAQQSDSAYEISLSRDIVGLASSVGYHHYGASYATIANPNFSNDRVGFNVSLGSQIGFLGWQTSFSSNEDNVDQDPTRAVVTSNNSGLNLSFNIQNWPALQLGFNVSAQNSDNEPNAASRVDNEGRDISLGLSDQIGGLNLSWSSSLGKLQDNLTAAADSDTLNHAFTIGYSGDAVNLDLNLSKNETTALITETSDLVSLGAAFPFFSEDVKLQTQLSLQQNSASDNSQDNRIAGGSARVGWALDHIFGESLKSIGGGTVSISYSFNKTTDALDPSVDTSDSRVLVEFSFGAPVAFEYNWQF
jgi:hypothetical protein